MAADTSAKAIMDRHGGAGPGFGALRLLLALSVLLVHSITVAQYDVGLPQRVWSSPLRPLLLTLLPMFFALSGFLVTGSALRTRSLKTFLLARILRLLPALTVEVTLSALILGPLLTKASLWAYFSDPQFFSYFANIVGHVQFYLPGMFTDAPMPGVVNLNLWTLAPEYNCYLFIVVLIASSALFDRRTMTMIAALVLAIVGAGNVIAGLGETDTAYGGPILLASFILGAAAWHWRDRIPVRIDVFCAACAILYVTWLFNGTVLLGLIPLTYCMIYLGMQNFPRLPFFPTGDYSYGIYLFGFPIQQTLIFLFPALKVWWALFPCAALATFAVAVVSWHLVELPALSLRAMLARRTAGAIERDASAMPGSDKTLKLMN